jgi:microcystin-dependent protein
MADPFVAEIRILPFNFAPKGWAQCDGQLIPISQNTALFSLLGTTYGGDGKTNFALPNLKGRGALHPGIGPGLTPRSLGETGGQKAMTLGLTELPPHDHAVRATGEPGISASPVDSSFAPDGPGLTTFYGTGDSNLVTMNPGAVTLAGGSLPHNNRQPYLVFNFCIALQGIFPSRP